MTLNELAQVFLAANKSRLSSNTLRAYGYDLGLLTRELPDIQTGEITLAHLRAFLQATAELTPLLWLGGRRPCALVLPELTKTICFLPTQLSNSNQSVYRSAIRAR